LAIDDQRELLLKGEIACPLVLVDGFQALHHPLQIIWISFSMVGWCSIFSPFWVLSSNGMPNSVLQRRLVPHRPLSNDRFRVKSMIAYREIPHSMPERPMVS
jgi:hypothetical protein